MMANVLDDISRGEFSGRKSPEAEKIVRLSGREREIISLICEGLKNKETADMACARLHKET